MRPISIDARDLPEAWFNCIKWLLTSSTGTHRYKIEHGSFIGHERLEFDFVTVHISYPGTRPLVPDVPLGVPPPCTQDYLDNYLPYLMADGKSLNEQYTYGEDIAVQIPEIIKSYKENGYNQNQAFMAVGNRDSLRLKDPQCLRMIDTRIMDGKLNFMVYFRSWDLWGGFPANLGGIQILKEYMASEIGIADGELIACSKGLHLYDHCYELAKKVIGR